ncbi:hypothetical protein FH972_025910 [Carpinus fangiana]|uniref:Small ribosomal subunit protein mS23 n=1 Tax=Carpinus fangiana TaxID=176857 RepID=A0A5N6L4Z4_9ROSI|nr:hypothetical protein FH972_025910 [Carpinus fangiana]
MTDNPPAQTLVRTQPVQHRDLAAKQRLKKPSRMFQPQRISYQEDELRHNFFADHPWELARPRVIVENNGNDHQTWDWSKAHQPGRPVSGESVIQRQLWLLQNNQSERGRAQTANRRLSSGQSPKPIPEALSTEAAYDQARKEFYEQRHFDEVERNVAREEAMSTGAYFDKGALEIGMELENAEFERWKTWAKSQVTLMEQARNSAYTGFGGQTAAEDETASAPDTLEQAIDNLTAPRA